MNAFQPRPWRSPARGLSVVETLCALAVLAVATGTAVPRYQQMRDEAAMVGLAGQIEADLQFARQEAMVQDQALRFTLGEARSGSCYMVHTGDAGDCRCTDAQTPRCDDGAQLLRAKVIGTSERAQLRSAVSSILFDGDRGTSTPAATLRVVAPDGRALHQVVNVMGRVRTCSPGKTRVAGFRSC